MVRAMLRDLRAHRGRVAMMLAAIVLGVGFVITTWVVSDSTARTLAGTDSRTDVGVVVQAGGKDAALTRADRAAALAATEPDAALMPADSAILNSQPLKHADVEITQRRRFSG